MLFASISRPSTRKRKTTRVLLRRVERVELFSILITRPSAPSPRFQTFSGLIIETVAIAAKISATAVSTNANDRANVSSLVNEIARAISANRLYLPPLRVHNPTTSITKTSLYLFIRVDKRPECARRAAAEMVAFRKRTWAIRVPDLLPETRLSQGNLIGSKEFCSHAPQLAPHMSVPSRCRLSAPLRNRVSEDFTSARRARHPRCRFLAGTGR